MCSSSLRIFVKVIAHWKLLHLLLKTLLPATNYQVSRSGIDCYNLHLSSLFILVKSSHVRNWRECVKDTNYLQKTCLNVIINHFPRRFTPRKWYCFFVSLFSYVFARTVSLSQSTPGLIYLHDMVVISQTACTYPSPFFQSSLLANRLTGELRLIILNSCVHSEVNAVKLIAGV